MKEKKRGGEKGGEKRFCSAFSLHDPVLERSGQICINSMKRKEGEGGPNLFFPLYSRRSTEKRTLPIAWPPGTQPGKRGKKGNRGKWWHFAAFFSFVFAYEMISSHNTGGGRKKKEKKKRRQCATFPYPQHHGKVTSPLLGRSRRKKKKGRGRVWVPPVSLPSPYMIRLLEKGVELDSDS